jgi:magnesium-transporting ATPase (P-type)
MAILTVTMLWVTASLITHYALPEVLRSLEEGRGDDDGPWRLFLISLTAAFLAEIISAGMMGALINMSKPSGTGTALGPIGTALTVAYYVAKFSLLVAVASSRYLLREPPFEAFVWLVSSPPMIAGMLVLRLLCLLSVTLKGKG